MKLEPTAEEREKIVRAMPLVIEIEATSIYISITECGLTEAQKFIKALRAKSGESREVRKEATKETSVLT